MSLMYCQQQRGIKYLANKSKNTSLNQDLPVNNSKNTNLHKDLPINTTQFSFSKNKHCRASTMEKTTKNYQTKKVQPILSILLITTKVTYGITFSISNILQLFHRPRKLFFCRDSRLKNISKIHLQNPARKKQKNLITIQNRLIIPKMLPVPLIMPKNQI